MADDVAGAVRRASRPTDDHQTPETTTPAAPGATNPGAPVSQDAGAFCVDGCPCGQTGPAAAACALDTATDVEAYAALPECTACEGTGKDTHATVFEAPLAVHFAGPPVEIEGRRRQLCMWCGHVLSDVLLKDAEPAWPTGEMIRVEDGVSSVVPYLPCDTLPPGCCALPGDEGEPVCICTVESTPCPDCRDENQSDDDEPVDPDDGYPVDLCGKHTGTCSNRCLLAAHHAGECDDDPGPDEAQETRAAADWPAEPVDTHADEVDRA